MDDVEVGSGGGVKVGLLYTMCIAQIDVQIWISLLCCKIALKTSQWRDHYSRCAGRQSCYLLTIA
jgi:hypothetical protein